MQPALLPLCQTAMRCACLWSTEDNIVRGCASATRCCGSGRCWRWRCRLSDCPVTCQVWTAESEVRPVRAGNGSAQRQTGAVHSWGVTYSSSWLVYPQEGCVVLWWVSVRLSVCLISVRNTVAPFYVPDGWLLFCVRFSFVSTTKRLSGMSYLCVFCFFFHTAYMLCYCQHSGVDLMGLKPGP